MNVPEDSHGASPAPARPYPCVTTETAPFWRAGEQGVLLIKRCLDCARFHHPPAPLCPHCLSDQVDFAALSGRARIVTYTVNHHQWHSAFPPPYVLAIVELEEAPDVRLTTRLCHAEIARVAIGMRVRVRFERVGPAWLPLFEPEEA